MAKCFVKKKKKNKSKNMEVDIKIISSESFLILTFFKSFNFCFDTNKDLLKAAFSKMPKFKTFLRP